MEHHARYGSTRYWLVGGCGLAGAAFTALIVEAVRVPMGHKLTAMLVTLAAVITGVLIAAAAIALRAVAGLNARHDDLKQCTVARYDELNQRINNQCIEAYSLGLAQGSSLGIARGSRMNDGTRVN